MATYVEIEDIRDEIDIEKLNRELDSIVEKENKLREQIAKIIIEMEGQQ